MALEKLEGEIRFTAAQTVDIVEQAGPTATVTVAAGSTYFLTSNAALLAAVATALNDNATLAGTYTLTLDDDADAATGKVTISATGVGSSFSVTWNTTALRDALGWTGSLTGATTYQASQHARYLWLPNCGRSNPMAPNPASQSQDMGMEESDYTITVAPTGASKRIGYNRRLVENLEWAWLKANKVKIEHETITNESLQRFWRDTIVVGRAVRYHPDRSVDSIAFEWGAREGHFKPTPNVSTWVGPASTWTYRMPVVGQPGSASWLVLVSGTSSVTEADDTLVATGTVATSVITGTLSVTEADDTLVATGFLLPAIACWLKSDVGITLVGTKVSQWDDQSGNGEHVTQGTDANRPEKVDSVIDGYPVVRFLSGGTPRVLAWTTGPTGAQFTAVVVWKQVAATGAYQLAVFGDSLDSHLGYNDNQPTAEALGALHWGVESTVGNVYAAMWSNATAIPRKYIVVNAGSELDAAGTGVAPVATSLGYAATNYALESDIAEVRIYLSRLTSAQWTNLYAELKSRYASLP
ncbi:MAG: hypothetical protein AAB706_03445 [Patescibacteria group bacterium]